MTTLRWRYLVALLLPFALALASLGLLGSYSRTLADDYCTAADGLEFGPWGSAVNYYQQFSGFLADQVLKGFIAPLQPAVHLHLTSLLLLLGAGVLALLAIEVCHLLRFRFAGRCGMMLGIILWYAIISTAPSEETLYWLSSQSYLLSVILTALQAVVVVYALRQPELSPRQLARLTSASAGIAFINTGLTTTQPVFLIMVGGLLFLWVAGQMRGAQRRDLLVLLGVTLVALGIGFLIQIMAPGNAIRQQLVFEAKGYVSGSMALPLLGLLALAFTIIYTINPPTVLACSVVLVVTAYLTYQAAPPAAKRSRWQPRFMLSLLLGVGIAAVLIALPLYGVAHPSPRALLGVRLWQMGIVAYWGYLVGLGMQQRGLWQARIKTALNRRMGRGVLIGLVVLLPLLTTLSTLARLPDFAAYAAAWDARHATILAARAAGGAQVAVSAAPTWLEDQFGIEPLAHWQWCASRYYGITLDVRAEAE